MNRRITIFDEKDFETNYLLWWSLPLGQEIYSISNLMAMTRPDLERILSIGEGDAVLVACSDGWKMIKDRYHVGVRSEGFVDCQQLKRLSVEGGAFLKCIPAGEFPEPEDIAEFMDPGFTTPVKYDWFKQKVLKTLEEANRFMDWAESQPMNVHWGFDYEGSGMPLDKWYELSGFSLCTTRIGAFVSLTDIRHRSSPEDYQAFLLRLGRFLETRMKTIWVFNMQYEFLVSHRMLGGVDLYNLCDSGVFNILDGYHLNKKYSLKWTAQRILGVQVWDAEFDRISDLIDSMLFTEVGKTKAEKHKVLKVTPTDYQGTPEWAELCKRYPTYIAEFESLIAEYWGNPFMCIPSDILGYYCNLDAFYTLMLYETKKTEYTWEAIDTFLDNLRLACRLHSCGIPKWESYRKEYEVYCEEQMAWGITYCAAARCKIKMNKHQAKMADIKKYPEIAQKLLKNNKFFGGDPIAITKDILVSNLDTMDTTETGLNDGLLLMNYGPDFAEKFLEVVKNAMVQVKMKTKIDDGIIRKKKILGIIAEEVTKLIGLDKLKLGPKHIELEKYLYYERAYNELIKISRTQLTDINNVPDAIIAFGQKFTRLEYSDYISENYFKCKSPIENDEICLEFAQLFPSESSFLAALHDSIQQLNGTTGFYKNLGITTIEDAFKHFQTEYTKVWNGTPIEQTDYPEKVYSLAYSFYNNLKCDEVKEIWSDFKGFESQEKFFGYVGDQFLDYEKPFEPTDLDNNFFFMRKLVVSYLMYKKYAKVLSTYIDGMFTKTDTWVMEDPISHVMIREADPSEPGAVCKMRPKFQCMEKSSKRWSSGYHTIISHSDIKSTLRSYSGHLLSYFDISSAEVKSAGFASGDPDLINMFINGIDVYIATAKLYLGEAGWGKLTKGDQKEWRKKFKTIFLGILYGLGKQSLATRLNCSVDEAEKIIQAVYTAYPKLREYVAGQQQYVLEHEGYINTFFGDKLRVAEWKWYKKAKTEREKKNLEARMARLGVNLPIQGGTSTAMSSGFFKDLRVATQEGWALTSFVTVHDSNTCDFSADKLWGIRSFYDKNFTDFCYEKTGIKLLFDILIGVTYEDACEAKQISDDIVELKGNARSHLMIIEEMNNCPGLKYEINVPLESIVPNYIEDPVQRFVKEKGCSMVMDKSSYTIQYRKLS